MPNHVTNILTISENGQYTEAVESVFEFLKTVDEDGEEQLIDFNKIVPMPESLNITSGSSGRHGQDALLKFGYKTDASDLVKGIVKETAIDYLETGSIQFLRDEKQATEAVELGIQYLENKNKYGYTTWYDWSVATWGTKWNAYDIHKDGNTIRFDTAWSPVVELIEKLSALYPNLLFEYKWADENTGHNVGQEDYQNGEAVFTNEPKCGSREAYELAFEINPSDREYYKLVDGQYEYDEDY